MKTIGWRHTNWNARNFVFQLGQEIVGQLNFYSSWNFNAVYTDNETKLKFAQKGPWGNIVVTRDEEVVGRISGGFFSRQILTLSTGEKFELSSNFWGRNVHWKDATGETIIKYNQATFSSMGNGTIFLKDRVDVELEKLLISAGLYVRQLTHKRAALVVVFLIPIWAASGH